MAKIKVEFPGSEAESREARQLMEHAADAAYNMFGYSHSAAIDIFLITNEEIRELNREHRGVDKPTDVLSFPMTDIKNGQTLGSWEDFADPATGEVFLGDVVISLERAKAQAAEYGHSFDRECAYLTVHSLLHLLGFDHESESDKLVMRKYEEQAMEKLGLVR